MKKTLKRARIQKKKSWRGFRLGFVFFRSQAAVGVRCPSPAKRSRAVPPVRSCRGSGRGTVQDAGVDTRCETRRGDGVQRRWWRRQLVPGPHGRGLPRHPRSSQARRPHHRGPRRPRESPELTFSLLWLAYLAPRVVGTGSGLLLALGWCSTECLA